MYDELVEALRLCVKYGKAEDALTNAQKAADAIEKLSKQNEKWEETLKTVLDFIPHWIPVTERLPEDGIESVLAYANGDGVECLSFITTAYFNKSEWRCGWNNTKISTVTHWMPLPEPPKEETE